MTALHGGAWALVSELPDCPFRDGQPAAFRLIPTESPGKIARRIKVVIADGSIRAGISKRTRRLLDARLARDSDKQTRVPIGKIYCRIVRPSGSDPAWTEDELADLGNSFPDPREQFEKPVAHGIPSAYVYLAQWTAHELSNIIYFDAGDTELRAPTSAFDLRTLFDAPLSDAFGETARGGGVAVGPERRRSGPRRYGDLPRNAAGRACIPDLRNDENLGVAQVHVALSKFHQLVHYLHRGDDARARRCTLRHVQSIILHDLLKRLVEPSVYHDVIERGRAVVYPRPMKDYGGLLLPVEFAAACFRVGHSMVRDVYDWNDRIPEASLDDLLRFSGASLAKQDGGRLPESWIVDWSRFLGAPDDPLARADRAGAVDEYLPGRLLELPGDAVSRLWHEHGKAGRDGRFSIAVLTLLRGRLLGLPPAETVVESVNEALAADGRPRVRQLMRGEMLAPVTAADDRAGPMRGLREMVEEGRTPLWVYCLREAAHLQSGQRLGPLASRIVMETIHAALEAADGGIVRNGRTVDFDVHELLGGGREYSLPRLVAAVSRYWSADQAPIQGGS
jgi:hypothetical protein